MEPMSHPGPEPYAALHLGEPASTVDRVAEELRRAIFEGELESGTPLREQALAHSLEVARSTVREALTMLVAEGLAERVPNRGVTVAVPEETSVRDICAARFALEGAGVRQWNEATEEARKEVHRTLTEYIDAVHAGGSYQALNALHLAFHLSLVGLTGSPRLLHMQDSLVTELKLALAQVERIKRNAHDQAESHAALVALLDDGDLVGAERFLRAHLDDAADEIVEALGL